MFKFEVDIKDEDTEEYRNVGGFNELHYAINYMRKIKKEGRTVRLTWL